MASVPPQSVLKVFMNAHIFLYRLSKGKIGATMLGLPVLLLTTIGRKSGRARTTPLVYVRDGDQYLIAATAGGADQHPSWFLNLQNMSEAMIEVGGKTFSVKVTLTDETERAQLYERFKAKGDNFIQYQQKTDRPIPVIRLNPSAL
jgi:F420H(2)-dependent quinone reductase